MFARPARRFRRKLSNHDKDASIMKNGFLKYAAVFAAATSLLAGATVVGAQGMTSEQAQQILDELKAIRKTLEQRPVAPAPAQGQAQAQPQSDKVSMAFTAGGFSVGKEDAPLVLVEYTD